MNAKWMCLGLSFLWLLIGVLTSFYIVKYKKTAEPITNNSEKILEPILAFAEEKDLPFLTITGFDVDNFDDLTPLKFHFKTNENFEISLMELRMILNARSFQISAFNIIEARKSLKKMKGSK